jgi:hypothetical protein
MRVGRLLPALSLCAAAAMALALAGAGTAAPSGPDLSTSAGADGYLLSMGVDPASVAHQAGLLNYAGPKCPGKGWSCTTNTRVVQISASGGQNRVECDGDVFTEEGQTCVVVQEGDVNNAVCVERSTAATEMQSCSIMQSGARNDARIDQSIDQRGGATQDAVQTASLVQTSSGGFNHAKVGQDVQQSTSDGTDQTQDAHQSAEISQTGTGVADNDLQTDQGQHQKAFGGTTQDQNESSSGVTDCSTNTPAEPNQCANVQQESEAGNNSSHLRQSVNEDANADKGGPATQQQGSSSGGTEARVHQKTDTGHQLNDANQDKHQHLSGPDGSTQTQFDPMFCCGAGSQIGGTGRENINQQVAQDATDPNAAQEALLLGQSLTPDGTCDIKQMARNNIDSARNAESLTPCPFLELAIVCANGPTEIVPGISSNVGIEQQLPPGCETFENTGNEGCTFACEGGQTSLFALRPGA